MDLLLKNLVKDTLTDMRYYVTLFDSNYLARGLTLYRSLLREADDFHLWVICFDDLAYELLTQLNLEKVTPVSLSQFEDDELLRLKKQRSQREYCWTCTPSSILYVLNTEPQVNAVTYLDADLMFFSSPEPIFEENESASILLTHHRYIPQLEHMYKGGIYNVQFMNFKRDLEGLRALNWWRERCNEWCFARFEANKFGDQKYLDDWTERFQNVHIVQHPGAGLAPWNNTGSSITKVGDRLLVDGYPLIFYHFHTFKLHPFNIVYLCNRDYPISRETKQWIYSSYLKELLESYKFIHLVAPEFKRGISLLPTIPKRPWKLYGFLKRTINEIYEGRYFKYV